MDKPTPKPKRRGRESILQLVLLVGLLLIGASIILPTGGRARPNAYRASCQSNLKQIMLAFSLYAKDNDQRFPITATSPHYGWADAVQIYLKAPQLYQCRSENHGTPSSVDPTQPQYTDYWFNSRLSRVEASRLSAPTQTIALGEGNDGTDLTDARYHLLSIPPKWRKDDQSPLFRHLDGANFAFADGHVKSVPAKRWENELNTNDGWTFRLNPK